MLMAKADEKNVRKYNNIVEIMIVHCTRNNVLKSIARVW